MRHLVRYGILLFFLSYIIVVAYFQSVHRKTIRIPAHRHHASNNDNANNGNQNKKIPGVGQRHPEEAPSVAARDDDDRATFVRIITSATTTTAQSTAELDDSTDVLLSQATGETATSDRGGRPAKEDRWTTKTAASQHRSSSAGGENADPHGKEEHAPGSSTGTSTRSHGPLEGGLRPLVSEDGGEDGGGGGDGEGLRPLAEFAGKEDDGRGGGGGGVETGVSH